MIETTSAPPGSSTVTSVFTAPGAMCLTRPFKVLRALICDEYLHIGLQDPRDALSFLNVTTYWSSQRSATTRERTSTAAAIPTNNTASARAADKSVSNAAIMAKDIVCVRPAKFPANISVAPNSDTARARQRTMPLVIPQRQRQGHVPEARPGRGPIHRRGFLQLRVNSREPQLGTTNVERPRHEELRQDHGRHGKGQLNAEHSQRWAKHPAPAKGHEQRHPPSRAGVQVAGPWRFRRATCPGNDGVPGGRPAGYPMSAISNVAPVVSPVTHSASRTIVWSGSTTTSGR